MNRTVLLLAGAVSAGVHAGLAHEHLHEWPPRILGALLGSLVVAYALTRLAALPPLDPDREQLDLLGVCTRVVEAAGLVAAVRPRLTLVPSGGPA